MKYTTLLLAALFSMPVAAESRLADATELYQLKGVFQDGALIYRPEGSLGIQILDLRTATIIMIKHGPPRNCMELIINTPAGNILGGCAKPLNIERSIQQMERYKNETE